ncbi:IclR family transcriptional regulator [Streptomyces zagrosensis]|uniref:DNA-binding IclR family transcriptional regulator n=1 Tax=Streptomyces zagrosensis TaxID=1042984 RepID=A0A7W9V0Q5_9ACTN|nr:IclR family transcriptional regulator [Streptomyces zagrosensis]MBB5937004.1 DNA-binding IclR family transcriptional regulator [Streptomyces zagrosensis]
MSTEEADILEEADHQEKDTTADRPAGLIGAVDNVLRLLRLFEDHEMIRVNQVSRDMGLSRSTVHRLLSTLSYHEFVEQDTHSRAYRPGPVLVDIGLSVVRNMDIRSLARGSLVQLRDETDETVHLATRRGTEVLYIDSVESEQTVRVSSRIGWCLPAHATAAGKVMLAALSDEQLTALYPSERLDAPTARAPATRTALRGHLHTVRERGYAVNHAESEDDVSAVGVAIRDQHGQTIAALVTTAPKSRGDEAWIAATARVTTRVAAELTSRTK